MRALVLVPVLGADRAQRTDVARADPRHAPAPRANADRLEEAVGLAQAIDLDVAGGIIVPVPQPRPATLFGSGKVEEIKAEIEERDTGLVIVDHAISPVQQRNLERAWNVKVIDRTGLILEIFGRRARTREGRLQVELAHLDPS
jgi:GTP-binding protein HflX